MRSGLHFVLPPLENRSQFALGIAAAVVAEIFGPVDAAAAAVAAAVADNVVAVLVDHHTEAAVAVVARNFVAAGVAVADIAGNLAAVGTAADHHTSCQKIAHFAAAAAQIGLAGS